MSVFIGGAWLYANGSLHIGHLSSLLTGDVLARYFRLKGEDVLYVSGSDCNGTPIAIKAKQEGVSPKEIADKYHNEFKDCFEKLGFTFDCYTRTDHSLHHQVVQEVFLELLKKDKLYTKVESQCFCKTCNQFLADRYVEGICPNCGAEARGDQCDYCSKLLNPIELIQKRCRTCGDSPIVESTEHFYMKLRALQEELECFVSRAKKEGLWRDNAIQLSERYLREGLVDRAVSRDLSNGVRVPVKGFENKTIYVWIEAVIGYYSASKQWAKEHQADEVLFWNKETISYYVHGKDNIPFHSIIWPAILKSIDKQPLPTHIVSNEFLTIEQKKLSTSRNWAIWVPDILKTYQPDSIRYFLIANAPESRDADFSWREFIYSHNSELLGAYGNLVNRTLKFVEKYYGGTTPKGKVDTKLRKRVCAAYDEIGALIEDTKFKLAIEALFSIVRDSNKYFDEKKPWNQIKEDEIGCANTIATCVYTIANLAQLLNPFLPFSSQRLQRMLRISEMKWMEASYNPVSLSKVELLFEKIDLDRIDEEIEILRRGTDIE
ncbi:methionine--tRNA ligase [Ornithinibacillus bavariensis]|uniref:Methionine--tRNA ligase n=1 Tax=Ornithinibacillus bavariensis TaxID=545502 RepID=A0A919XBP9_9BACI|nr:methionine--tRNA ligase [Ornithinibacillus bavariensis]GIO28709.1 methionine--tRNA ligase 2 [Ornithinibacillus bavariensis]